MEKRKSVMMLIVGAMAIVIFMKLGNVCREWTRLSIQTELVSSATAHILTCILTGAIIAIILYFILPQIPRPELEKPQLRASVLGLIGMIAMVVLVQSVAMILDVFVDCGWLTAGNISPGYSLLNFREKLVAIISIAIAAPLIEEVMFRGLVFGSLNKLFGLHIASVLSAIAFGVLHGTSLFTILGTGLSGVVLAYVYGIYGNLSNCICIHALYNFIVVSRVMISEDMILGIETLGKALIIIISILAFIVYSRFLTKIYRLMRRDLRKKQRSLKQTC